MKAIELHYQTLNGPATAFVFVDDAGMVTSEKGLPELVATLRQLKHGKSGGGLDSKLIADFLNLDAPCPRAEWADLRSSYAAELARAERAGCSSCDRSTIARKFVKILYDQSRIDGGR